MGIFRRLRDRFMTDVEVSFPRPADAGAWSFEIHDFFRDRIVARGDETTIRYVFLGGLPRLPSWLRIVSPDGAAITVSRGRLGLVEVRARHRRLRLAGAAFYLAVGERFVYRDALGLTMTFRRVRRRDLRLLDTALAA